MLVIGLTGGIGSGKSTVTAMFESLGIPVIDADKIAHALTSPGQPAVHLIAKAFGDHVLNQDNSLNRQHLREIVFADEARRKQLEALLHPLIRAEMQQQVRRLKNTSYCILCIPLLLEVGQTDMVDRVLVVDCPQQTQRERLHRRDQLDDKQIDAILAAQLSREHRLQAADDVISNNTDLKELQQQVHELDRKYRTLATIQA